MKPTAAKGTFPYPHRTMAQVAAQERGERLSSFVTVAPRNAEMDRTPRMTEFGRKL